jgi:hypothetical protein
MGSKDRRPQAQAPRKLSFWTFCTANGEINDEYTKMYFAALEAEKEAITTDLGYALSWHNPENSHTCRLYVRKSVNLRDQQTWLDQHRWLLERLEDLHRVFAPRVRVLTVPAGA